MPELVLLDRHVSDKGCLIVIEKLMPGTIRRVFYMSDMEPGTVRGRCRHHHTWHALVCVKGSCQVFVDDGNSRQFFELNEPTQCLILSPRDWHKMQGFSPDALLLVLANKAYDEKDLIAEPYV